MHGDVIVRPHPRGSLAGLRVFPAAKMADTEASSSYRVSIKSVGLNFRDVLNVLGMYPGDPGPPGSDCAGIIISIPTHTKPELREFRMGQEVFGQASGCLGTVVDVPSASMGCLVPKPPGVSFEVAAATPTVFITALACLMDALDLDTTSRGSLVSRQTSTKRILVHAATGGLGLALAQVAALHGATVVGTSGTSTKRAVFRNFMENVIDGKSDKVLPQGVALDSRSTSFADALQVLGGVDVVCNSLTSSGMVPASISTLKLGGTFLEVAKRDIWSLRRLIQERPDVNYCKVAVDFLPPLVVRHHLSQVSKFLASGLILPLPCTIHSLGSMSNALRQLSAARHVGKVMLSRRGSMRRESAGRWVITGGTGGLGLAVAVHLVRMGNRNCMLLSRSGVVGTASTLSLFQCLSSSTSLVTIVSCNTGMTSDFSDHHLNQNDPAIIHNTRLASCHFQPAIQGVVHSSGIVQDATLGNQSMKALRTVFGSKINDMIANLGSTSTIHPLSAFVLFGSIAGTLGTAGQATYAAANSLLEMASKDACASGLPSVTIAWGAWAGIGMAANMGAGLLARMERSGYGALEPETGIDIFSAVLRGMISSCQRDVIDCTGIVVAADIRWSQVRQGGGRGLCADLILNPITSHDGRPTSGTDYESELQPSPSAAIESACQTGVGTMSRSFVYGQVKGCVARVLGSDDVEDSRPLVAAGIDSLGAVELRNELSSAIGSVSLPATLIFDYPTVAALTDYLVASLSSVTGGVYGEGDVGEKLATGIPFSRNSQVASEHIVCIQGSSARLPQSGHLDAILPVPLDRWDVDGHSSMEPRFGGFVAADWCWFDAEAFGISPAEAFCMDPQQRCLLHESSSLVSGDASRSENMSNKINRKVSVAVGIAKLAEPALLSRSLKQTGSGSFWGTGIALSAAAGRISFTFGFTGPCVAIDTACSSSLVALGYVQSELRLSTNQVTQGLVCGVNLPMNRETSMIFAAAGMMSRDGRCKTLDASADGYVRSEACIVVKLCTYSPDMLTENNSRGPDHDVVCVAGFASNQDGRSSSLTAPHGPSQQTVIRDALKGEAFPHVVELHGTGTALGDPIEVGALCRVANTGSAGGADRNLPLVIATSKSRYGHGETAAGLIGVLSAVDSLLHAHRAPCLHLRTMNDFIAAAAGSAGATAGTELSVSRETAPLHNCGFKRSALAVGISAFAFQGTNAHVNLKATYDGSNGWGPESALISHRFGTSTVWRTRRYWYSPSPHPGIMHVRARNLKTNFVDLQMRLTTCSGSGQSYLMDHLVGGQSIMPAAGFLDVFSAAMTCLSLSAVPNSNQSIANAGIIAVQDASFTAPLVLFPNSESDVTVNISINVASQRSPCLLQIADARGVFFATATARLLVSRVGSNTRITELGPRDASWKQSVLALQTMTQKPKPRVLATVCDIKSRKQNAYRGAATVDAALHATAALETSVDRVHHQNTRERAVRVPAAAHVFVGAQSLSHTTGCLSHFATAVLSSNDCIGGGEKANDLSVSAKGDAGRFTVTNVLLRRSPAHARPSPDKVIREKYASLSYYTMVYRANFWGVHTDLPKATNSSFRGIREKCGLLMRLDNSNITEVALPRNGSTGLVDSLSAMLSVYRSSLSTILIQPPPSLPTITGLENHLERVLPLIAAAKCAEAEGNTVAGSSVHDLSHPVAGVDFVPRLTYASSYTNSQTSFNESSESRSMIGWTQSPQTVLPPHVIVVGGGGALGSLVTAWVIRDKGKGDSTGSMLTVLGRSAESPAAAHPYSHEQKLTERSDLVVRRIVCDAAALEDANVVFSPAHANQNPCNCPPSLVIYAGGVLADGTLMSQNSQTIRATLAPKPVAASLWQRLTAYAQPTDLFLAFGSLAGAVGNAGQFNYAAANAGIESVMRHGSVMGLPSLTIHWGPWALGMADSSRVQQRMTASGLQTISPSAGIASLSLILHSNLHYLPPAVISAAVVDPQKLFGEQQAFQEVRGKRRQDDGSSATLLTTGKHRDRISVSASTQRDQPDADRIRDVVRQSLSSILGETETSTDDDAPLVSAGLDSLGAGELRAALESAFPGIGLPATLIYDHPTVHAIVNLISTKSANAMPTMLTTKQETPAIQGGLDNNNSAASNTVFRVVYIAEISCKYPRTPAKIDGLSLLSTLHTGPNGVNVGHQDLQSVVPLCRWDVEAHAVGSSTDSRFGGWLEDIDLFDAAAYRLGAGVEAISIDPQTRLLMDRVVELRFTEGAPPFANHNGVGVYVGCMYTEYLDAILARTGAADSQPMSITGHGMSFMVGRLSFTFGFTGPAISTDTACSSSLVAAHLGGEDVRKGTTREAAVCGVNLMLNPGTTSRICLLKALSEVGRCRALDAEADGYGRSEGVAAIKLCGMTWGAAVDDVTPCSDDADFQGILYLTGSGVQHCGRSAGLTAPNGPAQATLIRKVCSEAEEGMSHGLGGAPLRILTVSLHGTGTQLGDPIEVSALKSALPSRSNTIALMASKSKVGHGEGTAGLTGLLSAAGSLHHHIVQPVVNLRNINPHLHGSLGKMANDDYGLNYHHQLWCGREGGPLPGAGGQPSSFGGFRFGGLLAAAGTSSFGMSGVNAHAVVARTVGDPSSRSLHRTTLVWERTRAWPEVNIPLPLLWRGTWGLMDNRDTLIIDLSPTTPRLAFLRDHIVQGVALFPAAAMLESCAGGCQLAVVRSVKAVDGNNALLTNAVVHRPLKLDEMSPITAGCRLYITERSCQGLAVQLSVLGDSERRVVSCFSEQLQTNQKMSWRRNTNTQSLLQGHVSVMLCTQYGLVLRTNYALALVSNSCPSTATTSSQSAVLDSAIHLSPTPVRVRDPVILRVPTAVQAFGWGTLSEKAGSPPHQKWAISAMEMVGASGGGENKINVGQTTDIDLVNDLASHYHHSISLVALEAKTMRLPNKVTIPNCVYVTSWQAARSDFAAWSSVENRNTTRGQTHFGVELYHANTHLLINSHPATVLQAFKTTSNDKAPQKTKIRMHTRWTPDEHKTYQLCGASEAIAKVFCLEKGDMSSIDVVKIGQHSTTTTNCHLLDDGSTPGDYGAATVDSTAASRGNMFGSRREDGVVWLPKLLVSNRTLLGGVPPALEEPEGPVLVCGAAGGIGALVAQWSRSRGWNDTHLLLAVRDAHRIAKAAKSYDTCSVMSVDLATAASAEAICYLQHCPRRISTIHYATGVVEDGMLERQTVGAMRRCVAAKVPMVERYSLIDPVRRHIYYGSIASSLGSAGQGPYAAANAMLEGRARGFYQSGVMATTISWGAWGSVGMAASNPGLGKVLESVGVLLLDPVIGLKVLEALETSHRTTTQSAIPWIVADFKWSRLLEDPQRNASTFFQDMSHPAELGTASTRPESMDAPRLQLTSHTKAVMASPPNRRQVDAISAVTSALNKVLGRDVGALEPLVDAGLDSIGAGEVRAALSDATGLELPATLVFDHPTPNAIVAFVDQELNAIKSLQSLSQNKNPVVISVGEAPEAAELSIELGSGRQVDKQARLSNEVVLSSAAAPHLSKPGYYTFPSISRLSSMTEDELREVYRFVIGRRGVGEISFLYPVDLRRANLDDAIHIERGRVWIDPDYTLSMHKGLNRPALVTFKKVRARDQSKENMRGILYRAAARMGATFVHWDPDQGIWIIKMDGFY